MPKIFRITFILTIMIGYSMAHSSSDTSFIPLTNYTMQNQDWNNSAGEISYVSARCAATYLVMGSYLKGADMPYADKSLELGKIFSIISIDTAQSVGATELFVTERILEMSKIYGEKVKRSKQIHNEAFYPEFRKDIEFCKTNLNNLVGNFQSSSAVESTKPTYGDVGWTQESTGSKEIGPWLNYSPKGTRYCRYSDGIIQRLYPPGVKPNAEKANPFCLGDSTSSPQ